MKKKYTKQYIQFNDLVFDHVDMLTADDASVSFKRNETAYTFKHGDYNPHRSRQVLAESYTFSMTITLNMKKLPCEWREFYTRFAISELSKIGRLWAVRGNELLWAWAELDKYSEVEDSKKGTLDIDVDVYIQEGIWHKADLQRTFLQPWDICDFMNCYDFKDLQLCVGEDGGCCDCAEEQDAGCDCCTCNSLTREMALCYHKEELDKAYTCNGLGYKAVIDCEAAEKYFGNITHYLGQKLCTDRGFIGGSIYSNSDLDVGIRRIRINGPSKNPRIEINGNANQIMGEFEYLEINGDGSVYYGCDDTCLTLLEVGAWEVPEGNTYGWTIHPGNNRVLIDLNSCCGTTCAYFELDAITL